MVENELADTWMARKHDGGFSLVDAGIPLRAWRLAAWSVTGLSLPSGNPVAPFQDLILLVFALDRLDAACVFVLRRKRPSAGLARDTALAQL